MEGVNRTDTGAKVTGKKNCPDQEVGTNMNTPINIAVESGQLTLIYLYQLLAVSLFRPWAYNEPGNTFQISDTILRRLSSGL